MKLFRIITEIFGWLQIVASPFLISVVIALGVYFVWQDEIGFVTAIMISITGLMTGIILATRVWKRKGTINFISQINVTPELETSLVNKESHREAKEISLLEILILQLIDKHPSLNNQYGLTRFFAKCALMPDEHFKALDSLERKKLIGISNIKYTVKYYQLSDEGKQKLFEQYSIDKLKPYLEDIENSRFVFKILNQIEENNK